MARRSPKKGAANRKRVDFRRNRSKPARQKQWDVPTDGNEEAEDAVSRESVRAKGNLSRRRTIVETDDDTAQAKSDLTQGRVIAVRGRFVDVDDDTRVWPCTIRRILRTRLIRERHPVTVGDQVLFRIIAGEKEGLLTEGVIERVLPRHSYLTRCDGRRTHMIAANVDQVLLVNAILEPMIKPHLIDRYLVAAHAGGLPAIVCINKLDLGGEEVADELLDLYSSLGYTTIKTSAAMGLGIDDLRSLLTDKITLLAGQSGVGKSSLLNAIQPGLNLRTANVSTANEKGRHTTTTAVWLKLAAGGAVVDTPGIRALDVAQIPINELEMHFVEFLERIPNCKFPNCTHVHESGCMVKEAVETGEIDEARYESYLILLKDLRETAFYEAKRRHAEP